MAQDTLFYYIPPKVWASRKKRIHKLRQYADSLAVLYPFEADFFEKEQLLPPCSPSASQPYQSLKRHQVLL